MFFSFKKTVISIYCEMFHHQRETYQDYQLLIEISIVK